MEVCYKLMPGDIVGAISGLALYQVLCREPDFSKIM
jgi:hypothetical protein